ncbi:MAG: PQ-loop repeat-containing protein [Thermoplasmatota archaeon]
MAHLGAGEILIWAGTAAFTIALIPQLIRTVRLGRADDLSVSFVALILFASAATFTYWAWHQHWVAASGFVANLLVWGVVFYYRLWPRPPATTDS